MSFFSWLKSLFGIQSGPPLPKPLPWTIQAINPIDYLYGGSTNHVDWPAPNGYVQLSHKWVLPYDVKQIWTFHSHDGDGYQLARYGADGWVRFIETVDGGTQGTQYFVGETGWLVFGHDANEFWKEAVARLNISVNNPYAKMPSNYALTRYKRQPLEFTFYTKEGKEERRWIDTIISEHYDMETADQSKSMERSFFGYGYGLIRWEAWKRTPPTITDIPKRDRDAVMGLPIGGSTSPWYLVDVRQYTVEEK